MPSLNRILVAVDFSDCSHRALGVASGFAQTHRAKLDVLHVWESPHYLPSQVMVGHEPAESLAEHVAGAAERLLDDFVTLARDGGVRVDVARAVQGEPALVITDYASQQGCGLVVVGAHGQGGLMHRMLGGVAEKVVRLCSVPVLTVPCPFPGD